ncbi:right-handed parallel beta-helix repeat-containing protein [Burkholderia anthina]|uniref:right-handed parallel beta-helix repeat-containing protein n=1 Tax=Burkholderia anthina TaxID=179879 RepID=UPI001CF1B3E0|nr:right-handed parallel beta-helix repeat-containing protein [Burkholderia anthina]MCA8095257.1 right-handed parallel beta-helix repeat-containing protein [Burkholderia anthina]
MRQRKILGAPLWAALSLMFVHALPQNAIAAGQTPEKANLGGPVYVDCSRSIANPDGTIARPFTSLNSINNSNAIFLPGASLLFKRGTTCKGTLSTQSSGTSASPFTIQDYGDSALAAPLIDGSGNQDAISMINQQYIEIRNLAVTNQGAAKARRRGVHFTLTDIGVGNHYVVENMNIHDIRGDNVKDLAGSAGIQFDVTGSSVPTSYNDVLVQGNTIANVNRSGINMSSAWNCRTSVSCDPTQAGKQKWVPWTNFRVIGNTVSQTGGDGIVLQYTNEAKVRYNRVSYAANDAGNGSNAALWAWNADNTLFEHNEVDHTYRLDGNNDGVAFDIDYGQTGTIYQYNYSHDNQGGFLLICGCGGGTSSAANGIVRYNISQNDQRRLVFMVGGNNMQIYNNTFYLAPNSTTALIEETTHVDNATFTNNIFYTSTAQNSLNANFSNTAYSFSNNVFWPNYQGVAPMSNILASPDTARPGSGGMTIDTLAGYHLQASSPAIKTGAIIKNNGGFDFFGTPVPVGTNPDIGAAQYTSAAGE